jgi:hypothetical protein
MAMEILEEHGDGDFDYAEVGLVSPTGESWYKEIWYNEDRTGLETDIGNESISLINYLDKEESRVCINRTLNSKDHKYIGRRLLPSPFFALCVIFD